MKVRLDQQAKRDLIDIRTYLMSHASPAAAERVHKSLALSRQGSWETSLYWNANNRD
jgi:plasmid stabilization system protein ParE